MKTGYIAFAFCIGAVFADITNPDHPVWGKPKMPPAVAEEEHCYEDGGPYVCGTDEHYFAVCARELGRPCTDEDVFGPVVCRPDDTDCVQELKR